MQKIIGLAGQRLQAGPLDIFPATGPLRVRVVSMEFLLPDEKARVIWRGPLKMTAIRQLLSDIVWGDLDFLLIDLPLGTGDELLSVAQLLPEMASETTAFEAVPNTAACCNQSFLTSSSVWTLHLNDQT